MEFVEIAPNDFLLYAAKAYDNPSCFSQKQFLQDIARFKYLKKLLTRYRIRGDLEVHMIMNHLITIHNLFGIKVGVNLCFNRVLEEDRAVLKPFFLYLNYISESDYPTIGCDMHTIKQLREHKNK